VEGSLDDLDGLSRLKALGPGNVVDLHEDLKRDLVPTSNDLQEIAPLDRIGIAQRVARKGGRPEEPLLR
jgi:hypothetical protein